jgi:hypothetical protein
VLFTSIILLVVGYTMVYSAIHGKWQFWRFFFPAQAENAAGSAPAPTAPTAA